MSNPASQVWFTLDLSYKYLSLLCSSEKQTVENGAQIRSSAARSRRRERPFLIWKRVKQRQRFGVCPPFGECTCEQTELPRCLTNPRAAVGTGHPVLSAVEHQEGSTSCFQGFRTGASVPDQLST